jgi:hypothetical protein
VQDKRVPLAVYVSSTVAQMAGEAARQSDMTQSGYLRAALVRQLRSDGFDPAQSAIEQHRGNVAAASQHLQSSVAAASV